MHLITRSQTQAAAAQLAHCSTCFCWRYDPCTQSYLFKLALRNPTSETVPPVWSAMKDQRDKIEKQPASPDELESCPSYPKPATRRLPSA
jgi:hypothetical protein